ncbi:MAG: DVU0150 family protein [bacterium]
MAGKIRGVKNRVLWALGAWSLSLWLLLPDWVWAAGEKATNLVVVADTRRLSGIMKYFANLYNTNTLLFAIWAVVLTALWGAILGFLMDFLMQRTGLDLKSRKIVEH